jgi:hypothetical protein
MNDTHIDNIVFMIGSGDISNTTVNTTDLSPYLRRAIGIK